MTQYGFIRPKNEATFWAVFPVADRTTGEKTPLPSSAGLFKKGDIILDAFVNVRTAEATAATKTIDVGFDAGGGTENDPDGLLDGVSTATAGIVKGTLASGGQTKGALLRVDESGAGVLAPEPCVITRDDVVLTYTLGSAHTEIVADIYVLVARLPALDAVG